MGGNVGKVKAETEQNTRGNVRAKQMPKHCDPFNATMLVKDDPAAQTISSLNDHCLAWHMVNHDRALQTNLQELDVTKQLHQARGQTMALMEYVVQALVADEVPEETVTTDICHRCLDKVFSCI